MPHVPHTDLQAPSCSAHSTEGPDQQSRTRHKSDGCQELGLSHSLPPLAVVQVKLVQVGPVGDQRQQNDRAYEEYVEEIVFQVERVVHSHGTFLQKVREVFDFSGPILMFLVGLVMGLSVVFKVTELISASFVAQ